MMSVIGNELVPYDASLNHGRSTPSTSSSIVIDSSPPTEDEDETCSRTNDRLSDCVSSSDSDLSSQDTVVDKPMQLALVEHSEVVKDVDPACIKEILEDHERYPPKRKDLEDESIPATREKLNYFLKVLMLKISKYHKLAHCRIPPLLKSVPLALSYETFITLYWPGALSCCQRLFKSSQLYSKHYYRQHKPPSPPLNLSCVASTSNEEDLLKVSLPSQLTITDIESDNSSDIISLPDESGIKHHQKVQPSQQSTIATLFRQQFERGNSANDSPNPTGRKRKALSPSSRPGPLSHKQQKLNQTIAIVQSSIVESGDEKSRAKRVRRRNSSYDEHEKNSEQLMDQLNSDQMKFVPQHEPGAPENFTATQARINYFNKVLALKLEKYYNLNSNRPSSPSRHIPLALSLSGFMQFYWPGRVLCCGIPRENSVSLERHIGRCHRPPKAPPCLTVIPAAGTQEVPNKSEEVATASVNQQKNSKPEPSEKNGPKSPLGFKADQDKFRPQHIPGEPEDFLANQESIDYFVEVLTIKREKYGQMAPIKDKPLSSSYTDFVLHYWPGVLSCCDRVYTMCKDFAAHLNGAHLPPKKIPQPSVVDASAVPVATEPEASTSNNIEPAAPMSPEPSPTSPQMTGKKSGRLAIEQGSPHPTQQLFSIFSTPSHQLMINSIQEEARQLRTQSAQVTTLSDLMPLLERLLELSASITNRIRGVMDVEARSQATECLEYVWNASKTAIVRWEDLKGRTNRDNSLNAVQYAYGTLPVFINWEQSKHLEMVENVLILSLNTVKNWNPGPSSLEAKSELKGSSARHIPAIRRRSVKQTKPEVTMSTGSVLDETIAAVAAATPVISSVTPKETKGKNTSAVVDFCRSANIAIGQNTKANIGYKDNTGRYHAMYRYGIKQIMKLFCPPSVTHLKCCEQEFDRTNLIEHVLQFHEGSQPERTEPSISPV